MEFKREIQSRLEEWRRSSRRKPLVLRGARQVGKTTVVNQFGRTFDNYIYLNLEDAEAAALFDLNVPLADLIPFFFAHCKKKKVEGTTLIFIDEIQNSAKAVARLRYFYEQLPEIFVIAAGSLLENLGVFSIWHCVRARFASFLSRLAKDSCFRRLPTR